MIINFTIPGQVKSKARPRMSTRTGRAYTPKDTVMYENWVRQCYIDQAGRNMLEGTLVADITAYYQVPKTSATKALKMVSGEIRPVVKPDLDNVAKIVLDSLNGIAYADDKQIVELRVKKVYGSEPKVEVVISSLG